MRSKRWTKLMCMAGVVALYGMLSVATVMAQNSVSGGTDSSPSLVNELVTLDQLINPNDVNFKVLLIEGGHTDNLAYTKNAFLANMSGFSFDTHFVNSQGVPTLAQLQNYDVVLLWENGLFSDAQATGNIVEQYVQAGGKLVIGTFYWQDRSDNPIYNRSGWGELENIDPFITTTGSEYNNDSLDSSSIVDHSLTNGLVSMNGVYHGGVTARPETTVVANWSDGVPLIGFRNDYCIVGISHFPSHNQYIPVEGEFYKMWENALNFAATGCTSTIPVEIDRGLIVIQGGDQDYARFTMTDMTDLGEAALENNPVDLKFTIKNDDGDIAYEFEGEGTVNDGNSRLDLYQEALSGDGMERITCDLLKEECLIAIDPYVDIKESALNNPLTICLEVNGTVYCNTSDWTEVVLWGRTLYKK